MKKTPKTKEEKISENEFLNGLLSDIKQWRQKLPPNLKQYDHTKIVQYKAALAKASKIGTGSSLKVVREAHSLLGSYYR